MRELVMEDKVNKVELFEQIRKEHYLNKYSIRKIAKRYKIHRRLVRQAIANAQPPVKNCSSRESEVLTSVIRQAIDEWLLSDQKAPKKQRHTAQRIFTRLKDNYNFTGKLPTIKKHVGKRYNGPQKLDDKS